jgi:hypothetical protein
VSAVHLVVIIRAAGERTSQVCRELLGMQIRGDAVEIVNETPFEAALRRTYEIGLQRGAKWTMTLDADVLLREGAVAELVAEAERLPQHFAQIEGLVHDKLTGLFRKAGHRIYRTRLLTKALEALPPSGSQVRPEWTTLQRMEEWGFPSREVSLVVGIHDHEQYYRDVYRKAFVHANKHQVWLADIVSRCKSLRCTDDDFRIALRGLYDGLMSTNPVTIDAQAYSSNAQAAIRDLGLREKSAPERDIASFSYVARVLEDTGVPLRAGDNLRPAVSRLRTHHARCGTLRLIPLLIGAGLCRLGTALKAVSERSRNPTACGD